ncbi:MAG TPA: carotenoid oxygenase family protein [Kofleriaceae bacterium]|nr:carotenoid oxygenase family protein [Kofleriaceae bacterium]
MVAATKASPSSSSSVVLDMWSKNLAREHGFEPLRIEGKLPSSLRGTLYRNGPGQFGQFGTTYAHPFEGDGAVTAVRIADGKAHGASIVTPSEGLVRERAAGKILYGSRAPWPRRIGNALRGRDKNTANTSVVMWQGRLFALTEGAKPTELAPADLAMVGETDLGVIRGAFSAHPHRVDARNAIYNFGLEYGRHTRLHAYELPDVGAAREIGVVDLPAAVMLHDFIATETHLIWFVSPVRVDVPRAMLQLGSFDTWFRWQPEHGTEVIAMPIAAPGDTVRFTVDAFYQWHFANAFTHDRELVIDYVRYPDFRTFAEIGHGGSVNDGSYHRATIDLTAKRLRSEALSDRPCEFPTVAPGTHGREHAVAYASFDSLGAVGSIRPDGAIDAHVLPADEKLSEPLYASGNVLALCHARDAAYVAVYAAERIAAGPVAKIWIDHHVPITFHGVFAS